jgi:MoxR-like ATPase
MAHLTPPADPDPFLTALPAYLGGGLDEPIPIYYETPSPTFDVNQENERALHTIATFLSTAWNPKAGMQGTQGRAFLLYGPPGGGKNSVGKEIAAALALPYAQRNLNSDTRMADEIGAVVLEADPLTGATVSRARLGPIGLPLVAGGVVCINELQKAPPHTQSALQSILEDGYIEIKGTEAGAFRIPIHPSSVVICTMNQGVEGSTDRPEAAPLARMVPIKIDDPPLVEEARRVLGNLRGTFNLSPGTDQDAGLAAKEARRQEVLGKSYANHGVSLGDLSLEDVTTATSFIRAVRQLAADRAIGRRSQSVVSPGPRELERFVHTVAVTGDPHFAAEQLKIYCDAGPSFQDQWNLVMQTMEPFYGRDGQAANRRRNGQAPVQV